LDKWEKGRCFGQKALLLPPSLTTQNAGDRRPTVEGGRGAGDPVHGNGREVGRNEEEVEGNRFCFLPRAGVLRRGGSTAGSGAVRGGDRRKKRTVGKRKKGKKKKEKREKKKKKRKRKIEKVK
jgi:hypothetical protein